MCQIEKCPPADFACADYPPRSACWALLSGEMETAAPCAPYRQSSLRIYILCHRTQQLENWRNLYREMHITHMEGERGGNKVIY